MKPHRRVFVVGGHTTRFLGRHHPDFVWKKHPDFGERENPGLEDYIREAIGKALESTGVSAEQVDRGFVGNFLGELFNKQGHFGGLPAAVEPGLSGKPFTRVEAACASGGLSVSSCADAIQAGSDVTLALGVEIETNVPGKEGVEYMARAAHVGKQRSLDFALFPYLFGRRAKAYKEAFGAESSDMEGVVLKAYANANLNPLAQMFHHKVSQADLDADANREFLEDPEIRPHLRLLDCVNFTDGASCLILASEDGLKKLGISEQDCTEILAYGHSTQALGGDVDFTQLTNMRRAAGVAYEESGVSPGDVDVAEVHDCFSITELMMYEALGFADTGHGYHLIREGQTQRDGRIPVNTGGGLIGFGHPVGASGVKQVLEIFRQMKGRCGDYQLTETPRIGVSANLGGDDGTGVVMVQENRG